jgi:hypothetical protein
LLLWSTQALKAFKYADALFAEFDPNYPDGYTEAVSAVFNDHSETIIDALQSPPVHPVNVIEGLSEAVAWMQCLQGPQDNRIPDQSKVQKVIDAARAYQVMQEANPAAGEPVAWKVSSPNAGGASTDEFEDEQSAKRFGQIHGGIVEPVYAAPSQPDAVNGGGEADRNCAEGWNRNRVSGRENRPCRQLVCASICKRMGR